MDKQSVVAKREYFQLVHSVTLELIGCFTDADLDWRPKAGMRSVRDLIHHMYAMEKTMPEGILAGKLTQTKENRCIPETAEGQAEAKAAGLTTVARLAEYATECHAKADSVLAGLTDADIAKPIEAPFGTFPVWQYFAFLYDEHWHHRGQLYIYARLLDRQPPMLYDYPS